MSPLQRDTSLVSVVESGSIIDSFARLSLYLYPPAAFTAGKEHWMRLKTVVAICAAILVAGFVASTQLTLFVIPPIGAVPDGRTVLISRTAATKFVDSPDAVCERIQGGVSLL